MVQEEEDEDEDEKEKEKEERIRIPTVCSPASFLRLSLSLSLPSLPASYYAVVPAPVPAPQGQPSFLMFHAEMCDDATQQASCGHGEDATTETAEATTKDTTKYQTFLASRPNAWEDDAIALVIRLCEEYRVPCHIVHLSSASALPMIREAKKRGVPLTVETTYHYLYFEAGHIPDGRFFIFPSPRLSLTHPWNHPISTIPPPSLPPSTPTVLHTHTHAHTHICIIQIGATQFKCCPPIRDFKNREALWAGLQEGLIDYVVSDHSPCTVDLKVSWLAGGRTRERASGFFGGGDGL